MATFIKLSTLEFPRHEGDIRLEYPEITEDQTGDTFPCPDTYAIVEYVHPPEIDPAKQIFELIAPIQIDGVWKMQWSVRDLTQEELDNMEQARLDAIPAVLKKSGSTPNAI